MAQQISDPNEWTIPAHNPVTLFCSPEAVEFYKTWMEEDSVMNEQPKILASFASTFMSNAFFLCRCGSDPLYLDKALPFMVAALEYAHTGNEPGRDTKAIEIEGMGVFIANNPVNYLAENPDLWIEAMSIATVRKNKRAQEKLAALPHSLFKELPGMLHRNYFVRAWQQLHKGDPALQHLFEEAHEAALHRSPVKGTIGQFALWLDIPKIDVLKAIAFKDAEHIDEKLANAFRLHRKFYDRAVVLNKGDLPLRESDKGILPLQLAAMLQLAREHFPSCKVSTEYAPDWLFK